MKIGDHLAPHSSLGRSISHHQRRGFLRKLDQWGDQIVDILSSGFETIGDFALYKIVHHEPPVEVSGKQTLDGSKLQSRMRKMM
jgi:hypothetical protein